MSESSIQTLVSLADMRLNEDDMDEIVHTFHEIGIYGNIDLFIKEAIHRMNESQREIYGPLFLKARAIHNEQLRVKYEAQEAKKNAKQE